MVNYIPVYIIISISSMEPVLLEPSLRVLLRRKLSEQKEYLCLFSGSKRLIKSYSSRPTSDYMTPLSMQTSIREGEISTEIVKELKGKQTNVDRVYVIFERSRSTTQQNGSERILINGASGTIFL